MVVRIEVEVVIRLAVQASPGRKGAGLAASSSSAPAFFHILFLPSFIREYRLALLRTGLDRSLDPVTRMHRIGSGVVVCVRSTPQVPRSGLDRLHLRCQLQQHAFVG